MDLTEYKYKLPSKTLGQGEKNEHIISSTIPSATR
jgi:hypothetical protein